MMNRLTGLVVAALVTGLGLGFVCAQTPPTKPPGGQNQPAKGEDDDEVTIKLTDAPEAVRAAFLKLAAEKDIKKMSKETDDGLTIYEVEWESAGKSMSADVSDKGDVLSIDTDIKADALPAAASAAIKKAFPTGTIKSAESVQEFFYEVQVMVDGKRHEIQVAANGQVKSKDEEGDEKD